MASENNLLSYIDRDSPVHRLTGATKLIVFLLWTIVCMISYDTRVLGLALILSIIVLKIARIKFSEIRAVVLFILIFSSSERPDNLSFRPGTGRRNLWNPAGILPLHD